jgi:hypothetical protein
VEVYGKRLFRDRERLNELCDRPSAFKAWLQRTCGAAATGVAGPQGGQAGGGQQADIAELEEAENEVGGPASCDLRRRSRLAELALHLNPFSRDPP